MLFIITENKDILEKTLPFVEELSISYSRTLKELSDYRIVQSEDVVLLANGDTFSSNNRKKFPEGTTLIDLGKNGGAEELDIAYLFIKTLGKPRIGAYLHDQFNLLGKTKSKHKDIDTKDIKKETLVANEKKSASDKKANKPDKLVKNTKKDVSKDTKKETEEQNSTEVKIESEAVAIKPKRVHIVDKSLEGIQETLISEGVPGEATRDVEVTYKNGVPVSRKVRRETFKITVDPKPTRYVVSEEKDRMVPANQKLPSQTTFIGEKTTNKPKKFGSSIAKDKKQTKNDDSDLKVNNKPMFVDKKVEETLPTFVSDFGVSNQTPNFVSDESENLKNKEENKPNFIDSSASFNELPTFEDEDEVPSMFRNN